MSTLRASAAEFVPTTVTGTQNAAASGTGVHPPLVGAPAQQQELQVSQDEYNDAEQWQAQYYEDGYYDEVGNWVYYNAEAAELQYRERQSQAWQDIGQDALLRDPWTAAPSPTDAACEDSDDWGGLSVTTDQAVGLMHAWYPSHSQPMLQQLYEACNYQLQDTLNILAEMEAEQAPTLHPTSAASGKAAEGKPARHPDHGQQAQDWPSLAAAAAAAERADPVRAHTDSTSSSTWATIAKKTAASAAPSPVIGKSGLDSKPRQPLHHGTSSQPAVQQVPWVTTGQAVSQEYADARAEASNHARVRNACFHQATIAYLAGERVHQQQHSRCVA